MAEVKNALQQHYREERELLQDTERKQLLLRLSALEETLLSVLTIAYGEPKARRLYQLALKGMEQSSRTAANYISQLG